MRVIKMLRGVIAGVCSWCVACQGKEAEVSLFGLGRSMTSGELEREEVFFWKGVCPKESEE